MLIAMSLRAPQFPLSQSRRRLWRLCLRSAWLVGGVCLVGSAWLLGSPVLAGSVTADSVWDQNDARQRAMEQMPAGSTVTGTRCEVISVGMGNDRYRCTVEYSREAAPLR